MLGTVLNVASVVGALVLGFLVAKTKKFKLGLVLSSVLTLFFYGLFTGSLFMSNFVVLAIAMACLIFVLSPSGSLALELACEITFPVGEATTGGIRSSVIQIFCPAMVNNNSNGKFFNTCLNRLLLLALSWTTQTRRWVLCIR